MAISPDPRVQRIINNDPTLTEISLISHAQTQIALLSKGLAKNQFLKTLNLSISSLNDIAELAEALKTNHSVTVLDLGYNPFGNDGPKALAAALPVNFTIQKIDLEACNLTDITKFAGALDSYRCSLRSLHLSHNKLGNLGASVLANSIKGNVSLTRLFLNTCEITNISKFAESLKFNLSSECLDLSGNFIGNAGGKALAAALKVNVILCELCIRACGLTDINEFAVTLKDNRTLGYLQLAHNQLGNQGGEALSEALKYNVTLWGIDISGCRMNTDIAWELEHRVTNNLWSLKQQRNQKEKDSKTASAVTRPAHRLQTQQEIVNSQAVVRSVVTAPTAAQTASTGIATTASTATGTSFLGRIVERVQALPVRQTISNIMSLTHANTYGRLMTLTGGGTFDRLQELPKQHDALSHQVQKLSEIDTVAIKALPEKHDALSQQVQRLAVLDTQVLELLRGRSEQLQRLFEEDTKTEFNKQEKDRINANPSLQIYYQFFVRLFNGTWMACQSINSRMVDNSEMYASDYVGQGVDQIGRCIPGIAMATGFFALAIQGWNYRDKRQAVQRMALLFPDLDTAFKQLSQLARQATLAQEKEISSMAPPQGVIAKIKEGIKDLTAFILASDANTPLKRKAEEDCKTLLKAIKEGKLPSQPTLNDLLCVIMGVGYKYQLPVAATASSTATLLPEVFPNHFATAPIPTPTATPAAHANVLEMAEQLHKLQAKDAERESEMQKMKEEMSKLKSQLPAAQNVECGDDQMQLQLSSSKQMSHATNASTAATHVTLLHETTVLRAEIDVIKAKQNEHSDDIGTHQAKLAALEKKARKKEEATCIIT